MSAPISAATAKSPPSSAAVATVAVAAAGAAVAMPSQSLQPTAAVASTTSERQWNTKNLGLRLGSDAVSAASAGALIAPLISIIDRSIMENASGRDTLLNSIKSSFRSLLLRPQSIVFSRPAALIFMLYGGTYLTANAVDTATSTVNNRRASSVTGGPAKFAASSTTNVGVCIYKDQAFVRMFGPPGAVPRPVPPASYVLFALRDCVTIFASFNVPPLLAPHIDARMSEAMASRLPSGATCAQFAAPAAVQLLSTPLHLLGLDLYNRPSQGPASQGVVSWRERWEMIRKAWAPSAIARICRIVPAFGVGGVVNTKVRKSLMRKLE